MTAALLTVGDIEYLKGAGPHGIHMNLWRELCDLALSALASPPVAPVAWIEHHKGGDNLVWEQTNERCSPLYASPTSPPAQEEQQPAINGPYATTADLAKTFGATDEEAEQIQTRAEFIAGARPTLAAAPSPDGKEARAGLGYYATGNDRWLIFFEDAERGPEHFTDEAAARHRFTAISAGWNAHLYGRVATNIHDTLTDVAPTPPSEKERERLGDERLDLAITSAVPDFNEPVAWMWRCPKHCADPGWHVCKGRPADHKGPTDSYEDFPLYARPTLRQADAPVGWKPYLHDRADGIRGHYCIARYNPDGRFTEFYSDGRWVSAGQVFHLAATLRPAGSAE